jgi:RNA polymerase sigma-B factor
LIVRHRWIAEQCARRFRFRGEPEEDLTQVAYLGLVKAVDRFDPGRGVPFHGYAIPTVLGEIKRYFRDATWSVGVPRKSKDLLSRLRQATDALHQLYGRSPTPEELASELHVSIDDVIEALEARSANRTSSMTAAVEARPQHASSTDGPAELAEALLEVVAGIDALDERSRKILFWRFFEECTQREIGERLGVGQVQVSRLLRSALRNLKTTSGP